MLFFCKIKFMTGFTFLGKNKIPNCICVKFVQNSMSDSVYT